MYNVDFLKKIPYFEEFYKEESNFSLSENFDNVIDSLTGLISRKYIVGYAHYLIEKNSPFRLAIIDLDNFKQINDNYGHTNGDKVLQKTSSDLMDYVADKGLCGRFGGDEYIIILNGVYSYDEIYEFIRCMFQTPKDGSCTNPFRKSLKFKDVQPFVSATLGVVQFPNDATTYEDLFVAADKALYRGKMKGRNCYIIYLHDKHASIDISKLKKKSILDGITRINHFAENPNDDICIRVKKIIEFVREFIISTGVYYITENGYCKGFNLTFEPEDIDEILDDNNQMLCTKRTDIIDKKVFIKIKEAEVASFIMQKCVFNNQSFGYLLIFDKEIQHIWQEEDALMVYVAAHLMAELKYLMNNQK